MKLPTTVMQGWIGGCNSLLYPDSIPANQYAWGVNMVNRGGIAQTRPGFRLQASIRNITGLNKLQGGVIFQPRQSRSIMLIAADGVIWMAKYPFRNFSILPNIALRADADSVIFQPCLKSVNRRTDPPNEGVLELITPKVMVAIQDGQTRPFFYDGSTVTQSDQTPPTYGAPTGTWMAWTGSRLWIAQGSRLYASDLASPDTFSEDSYIAEQSSFELGAEITGMVETSNNSGLLVFTRTTTHIFQSSILERTKWQNTPDFQKLLLPEIGCTSGRSVLNQYGLTWWMSEAGYINLDAAINSLQSSRITTVDGEMMRSKRTMFRENHGVCAGSYENFLLVSVPSGGRYNEETWVMDQAPLGQAGNGVDQAWAGIWTGIRPVTWMKSNGFGGQRIYCVSYDDVISGDTPIHVWEAFRESRTDNDGRILCQFETGMIQDKDIMRFRYAELDLIEILGDVELKVFFGGMRGPWHCILDTTLQAEIGSIGSINQQYIEKDTILESYKPQSRIVRTLDFSPQDVDCSVESDHTAGGDKGIQILVEWRGRMGIKSIKLSADSEPDANVGKCEEGEAGEHNIIDSAGKTVEVVENE